MKMNQIKKIAISNRNLLTETTIYNPQVKLQLLDRIHLITAERLADALILREKDLPEDQYEDLAAAVLEICQKEHFPVILHHFPKAAEAFSPAMPLHLSMSAFLDLKWKQQDRLIKKDAFSVLGVSTHTVAEALEAERLGAAYITASHIFPTACKPGLDPRGLDYLRAVCAAVSIPVYALGGIHREQIDPCMEAGAAGVCMMSEYFSPQISL